MYKSPPDSPPPADSGAAGDLLPVLLTVHDLAAMLQISTRSVWRKRSAGAVPAPIPLGGLVRWRRSEIVTWIAAGCPHVGPLRGGPRSVQ